jgi:aspartyl-tRNA(Asn)/glutamyl-tRNA(Gln) amidotransferase subunit C
MAGLTRKEVEEIALLARLHLEPDELARIERDLGAILAHFETLAAVDTTDVPPMTHAVPMDLRLRVDEPEPSLPAAEALRAAPARADDLFVVPAVISSDGDERSKATGGGGHGGSAGGAGGSAPRGLDGSAGGGG